MTFRFSSGKVIETGDAYNQAVTKTQFCVTGDAHGHVVFHVAWQEGRGQRQVNVRVCAETILALADAIRCCPNHINEDPRTGKRGPEHPPTWIGHAMWHLEHPDMVRPCLNQGSKIIDMNTLPAGRWRMTKPTDEQLRRAAHREYGVSCSQLFCKARGDDRAILIFGDVQSERDDASDGTWVDASVWIPDSSIGDEDK